MGNGITDYSCPYQEDTGDGFLYCNVPVREYDGRSLKLYEARTEVQFENCKQCFMGKAWRNLRCPYLAGEGKVEIARDEETRTSVDWVFVEKFRCKKLPGQLIDPRSCGNCTIRESAEIEKNVAESINHLQGLGFNRTVEDIEKARTEISKLDAGNINTKTVIRESANALEATLKKVIPAYGKALPSNESLGPLWNVYRSVLDLSQPNIFDKTIDTLVNGITGNTDESLRVIRNQIGDSHSTIANPPAYAEAYFYFAVTISAIDFVVRKAAGDGVL